MANNLLDEIIDHEDAQDASDGPSALDDIIDFEDRQGETQPSVPSSSSPLGMGRSEMVGSTWGTVGSLVGTAGGPPGRMLGAAGASAVGYGADRISQDLEAGGLDQVLRNIGSTAIDAAKFGLTEGITEGLIPGAGWLYNSGAGQAARSWIAKKWGERLIGPLTGELKVADDLIRKGQQRAALLANEERPAAGMTLGQMAPEGSLTAQLEGVATAVWGSGRAGQARRWSAEGARQYASDLANELRTVSVEDTSKLLNDAIADNFTQLYRVPADQAFDGLRRALPDRITVATPQLKALRDPASALGDKVKSELRRVRDVEQDPTKRGELDQLIKILDVTKSDVKKGALTRALPNLTFEQTLRLKNVLNDIAESAHGGDTMADSSFKTAAGTMAKQLDISLRKGLEKTPDLLREYDSAVKHYGEGIQTFKNDLINNVVKTLEQSPGKLEAVLLQPNNQQTLDAVKTALGPMWNQAIAPKLRSILLMNSKVNGEFSGKALRRNIEELIGANPERNNTMTALFGEPATKELLGLAKALELTEAPGAKAWWVKLRQASVIGTLAATPIGAAAGSAGTGAAVSGTGALVLLTPWALGHLTANPNMLRMFKDGIIETAQTRQISKKLDIVLTSLRQVAGGVAAPTGSSDREPALTQEPASPTARQPLRTTPQANFTPED